MIYGIYTNFIKKIPEEKYVFDEPDILNGVWYFEINDDSKSEQMITDVAEGFASHLNAVFGGINTENSFNHCTLPFDGEKPQILVVVARRKFFDDMFAEVGRKYDSLFMSTVEIKDTGVELTREDIHPSYNRSNQKHFHNHLIIPSQCIKGSGENDTFETFFGGGYLNTQHNNNIELWINNGHKKGYFALSHDGVMRFYDSYPYHLNGNFTSDGDDFNQTYTAIVGKPSEY